MLHINVIQPVTKDHMSCETTFLYPVGWSFKTGSTVHIPTGGNTILYIRPDRQRADLYQSAFLRLLPGDPNLL